MNIIEFLRKASAASGYSVCRKAVAAKTMLDLEALHAQCQGMSEINSLLTSQRDEAIADLQQKNLVIERLNQEVKIRHAISVAIGRYFSKGLRTPDLYVPIEKVQIDSQVAWVPGMLDRSDLSEPEFTIFRFFTDASETILDIGANYGYSAASIFATGSSAAVFSFEPNPWHFPCLQAIKDLRKGRFDFLGVALGSSRGEICFTMPVVGGIGISGLNSADIQSELDWAIPENLVSYAMENCPGLETPQFQFTEFTCPMTTLDRELSRSESLNSVKSIAAIKLDVEGFEAEVIAGAKEVLTRHRPLLLVEGANRVKPVVDQMMALGFQFGELCGDRIKLTTAMSYRVGGFYLHESRLQEYADRGMLE